MIKKLYRRYIYIIIIYSNIRSELKHLISNLMAIALFLPINYVFFICILGSEKSLYVFVLAIGEGRLFLAYLMEKYKCNFGKGYTKFLRYITYSTITFVTFGGTVLLIKDAQDNQSVTSKFSSKEITSTAKNIKLKSTNQKGVQTNKPTFLIENDFSMWKQNNIPVNGVKNMDNDNRVQDFIQKEVLPEVQKDIKRLNNG